MTIAALLDQTVDAAYAQAGLQPSRPSTAGAAEAVASASYRSGSIGNDPLR